jgi:urease accessory protein
MEPTAFLGLLATTRLPPEYVAVPGVGAPDRCRARLLTVTTVDTATAVVARAVADEHGSLDPVADAWAARTPNPALRSASLRHGAEVLDRADETRAPLPRPVALGLVAARVGVDAEDLARMVAYDDVQAVLSGEDDAQARVWTASLLPEIRALARQLRDLDHPERIPATGAPLGMATANR